MMHNCVDMRWKRVVQCGMWTVARLTDGGLMYLGINGEMMQAVIKACPSDEAKQAFVKQCEEVARENANRILPARLEATQRFLICTITDGVLYGNWPWTKAHA